MPITEPYVPATIKKSPTATRITLQRAVSIHPMVLRRPRPLPQLSYSHIAPIGWMHMTGPSRAPIRETKAEKAGMVLAMIQAITVIEKVQLNQTIQCVGVLPLRCREPRRAWTKMNFAGI